MGRCRGYESRHRIFWNSVRLALKQQVRDLAKSEREKVIRRGEALESSEGAQDWVRGATPPPLHLLCLSPASPPPPPTFLLSRKECLVSSSGNDNTENGLPGSKAEEKPPTKV